MSLKQRYLVGRFFEELLIRKDNIYILIYHQMQVTLRQAASDYSNVTDVKLCFTSMSHELIEEIPSRTLVEVLSNFGGFLGLMTGVSLMSLFEMAIYALLLVNERWVRYKSSHRTLARNAAADGT